MPRRTGKLQAHGLGVAAGETWNGGGSNGVGREGGSVVSGMSGAEGHASGGGGGGVHRTASVVSGGRSMSEKGKAALLMKQQQLSQSLPSVVKDIFSGQDLEADVSAMFLYASAMFQADFTKNCYLEANMLRKLTQLSAPLDIQVRGVTLWESRKFSQVVCLCVLNQVGSWEVKLDASWVVCTGAE